MENNTLLRKIKWKLWLLGKFKIPMIGFVSPRLIEINEQELRLAIPLKRRTKNHLNSMYFGSLMVGVDLAAGLHAVYFAEQENLTISLAFKSVKCQFLKRAEGEVVFVMQEGEKVKSMLQLSERTKERVNQNLRIAMYCERELVAEAEMELSIKVK